MMSINFTANFIRPVTIQKQNKPYEASFVSLNPRDSADLCTLSELSEDWKGSYSHNIYQSAVDLSGIKNPVNDGERYFAITTQEDSFDILDSSKVLGLAKCKDKPLDYKINFLQTKPCYAYERPVKENNYIDSIYNFFSKIFSPRNKFRGIGSAMLDCIKEDAKEKPIELYSVWKSVDFYKKQGFSETEQGRYFLSWDSNKSSD